MFNKALLVKQGWRIISNPNSLIVWVFKNKYFPYTFLFQVRQGARPSRRQQNIFQGQNLLEKGIRWQVNDGAPILCKVYNWIPRSFPTKPIVQANANPNIIWVSQLFDETSSAWNLQRLRDVFKEEEISNINIPLNLFRGEDSLVWHFSNLGIYSVKSGYALACNLKLNNRVDSSVNADHVSNECNREL